MPGLSKLLCVAITQFADVHSFLWDVPVRIFTNDGVNGKHYLSAASDGQSVNLGAHGQWKFSSLGSGQVQVVNMKASDGGRTMLSSKKNRFTDVLLRKPGTTDVEKWHIWHKGEYGFTLRSDTNWASLNENDLDEDESEQDGPGENETDNRGHSRHRNGRRRRRRTEYKGFSFLSHGAGKELVNLGCEGCDSTYTDWSVKPAGCQVLDGLWNPSEVYAAWHPVRELIANETQGVFHGTEIDLSGDVHFDWSESVKMSLQAGVKVGPLGGARTKASFHESAKNSEHFAAEVNFTTMTGLKREFLESDINKYIWQWNIYTTDSCGTSRVTQTQQLQLTPGGHQPPCCFPGYHDHDDEYACHKDPLGEDTLYPDGEQFGCKVWTSSSVV